MDWDIALPLIDEARNIIERYDNISMEDTSLAHFERVDVAMDALRLVRTLSKL